MLVQTTIPSAEPVSLAEARNHLRIDSDMTDDDALIGMLVSAARRYAEMYTGRSFITQGWRLVLDAFPRGGFSQMAQVCAPYSLPDYAIQLERGTVQSVASIQYLDMSGTWQTMPLQNYVAETSGCPARITPVFGQIWPITLPQIGSVKVDYTAGYGGASTDVPEGIRQWILMRVNTLYENREAVSVLPRGGKVEALPYVDALLDPYVVAMA